MMQLVFDCRTQKAPNFKGKTLRLSRAPDTLADMLQLLHRMGISPDDVSIGTVEFNYENGNSTWRLA